MTRKERMNAAYQHLMGKGLVHKQKDLAIALKTNEPNVSNILKGVPKALTNNIFVRLCDAFPGEFNLDWLLNEEGEMLVKQGIKEAKGYTSDIVGLYAQLIKEVEELRCDLTEELSEIRILRSQLTEDRDALRTIANQLKDALYNRVSNHPFMVADSDDSEQNNN